MQKHILDWIIKAEGGYVNHPLDKGGATNFGITQTTLNGMVKRGIVTTTNVKNLTHDDVSKIYEIGYYKASKAANLPKPLDLVHFDMAVNSGVGAAAKMLQNTINHFIKTPLKVDGSIGPVTIKTLNDLLEHISINDIINQYLTLRENFFKGIVSKNPSQKVFLNGWLNRLKNIRNFIKTLDK